MIYQILGWPRSRTAWLSAFLTYGPSFCFHEGVFIRGTKRLRSLEEYNQLVNLYLRKYPYVGDANTIGLLKQTYIFKLARVVIIERDKKEIENSIIQLGYSIEIPDYIEYPYNDNLVVKYEEIDDNLKEIWEFCLPGLAFPKERAIQFSEFNIQVKDLNSYI